MHLSNELYQWRDVVCNSFFNFLVDFTAMFHTAEFAIRPAFWDRPGHSDSKLPLALVADAPRRTQRPVNSSLACQYEPLEPQSASPWVGPTFHVRHECPEYRTSSLLPCGVLHTNAAFAACYTHVELTLLYAWCTLKRSRWLQSCCKLYDHVPSYHTTPRPPPLTNKNCVLPAFNLNDYSILSVNNLLLNGREQPQRRPLLVSFFHNPVTVEHRITTRCGSLVPPKLLLFPAPVLITVLASQCRIPSRSVLASSPHPTHSWCITSISNMWNCFDMSSTKRCRIPPQSHSY